MGPRVVFDTNVIISAYVFGGAPARLMRAAITGDIELVASPTLLAELARVLADKFAFDGEHVDATVRQISRVADVVRPEHRLTVVAHEADNRVLECAVEGGCETVVSGDRHLLGVGSYEGIRILTVAQAVAELTD
ncbi:MAG TPA: putative toxin-antitoxin system toxin component, PIN family [Coriobacteriia bacterium]